MRQRGVCCLAFEANHVNLNEYLRRGLRLSLGPSSGKPSSPYPNAPSTTRGMHLALAILLAILGLFIFPEVFDSAAIILGAYIWKNREGNTGLYIVILGIVCMLVGLYLTAFIIIGNFFP